MKLWFHMLLIMLCEALSVRRDAHIRFLKIQIEIYESKLKGNRVIPDPAERLRLLEAGAAVGHDVKDTLMVVELKTYILRDNDKKFTEEFDAIFEDENMEVISIPYEAPDANAFSESWIGNFKREVLNHFLCFGLGN